MDDTLLRNSQKIIKRNRNGKNRNGKKMKRTMAAKATSNFSPAFPLRLHLRSDLHIARKIWHAGMGIVICSIYYLSGISRSSGLMLLGSVLGLDLMMETARLKSPVLNEKILKVWGPLMRSCEVNQLSGVPYYVGASILTIAIFPKPIAILSILYLACGDPVASLFGILYGKRSIRIASGKSLIGTSAGVVTCMIATFVFLKSMNISDGMLAILTLVGGLAGGTAELLPLEIDDNFSIPVVSGFVLWLAFILLGI